MSKPRPKKKSLTDQRQEKEKTLILEYLQKMPVVYVACAKVGISRATYYRWLHDDEEFRDAVEGNKGQGIEMVNDMAESVVIKKIQQDEMAAAKYWLEHNHPNYHPKQKPEPRPYERMIIRLDR